MARRYYNPFDNKSSTDKEAMIKYVMKNYKEKIPKKYNGDVYHFMWDYRNGPGKCRICGAPTRWNKEKHRYEILCEPLSTKRLFIDPMGTFKTYIRNKGNSCKEIVRKEFIENSDRKVGHHNFMAQDGFQQKLLAARKISRLVNFKGKEFTVVGSYEELFLKVLSPLVLASNDVQAPGIEVKWTDSDGNKKLHITDFFLPKYNCVISIKDGGEDKNNHPSMVNRRRDDALKFKAVVDKTRYNVIELNGKQEINDFHKYFKILQRHIKEKTRYIKYPEYYHDYIKD